MNSESVLRILVVNLPKVSGYLVIVKSISVSFVDMMYLIDPTSSFGR